MSIWITKNEPGNRKSIFTIGIPLELIPTIVLILAAIVIFLIRMLR